MKQEIIIINIFIEIMKYNYELRFIHKEIFSILF